MQFCCLFFDFQNASLTIQALDSSSSKWNNNIYYREKGHFGSFFFFLLIDASITHPGCLPIKHDLKFLLDYLALKTMFWNNYWWLMSFCPKKPKFIFLLSSQFQGQSDPGRVNKLGEVQICEPLTITGSLQLDGSGDSRFHLEFLFLCISLSLTITLSPNIRGQAPCY